MAVELATAYIALVPSLKGASGKIASELGSIDTGSAGSEMGRKMGGGMVGSIKGLVGPAIALMGAGMFGGFIKDAAAASDATDKFKATMSFAGMDTSAITAAQKAAKQYADQTVYDLPTIQNMTAQLASNGVKDYTGLTQAAGNLNAVAGGNADTFKSVAMVMTQTAGAGKLTTENWNQMADAIPGAAGPLMSAMKDAGAYTGNFRDAMAAGQITSDEFNAALMKLGNQPVAVEAAKSTKTFEGAIGSLQATINSGLMSALDAMKPAITGAISGLSNGLSAIFAAFGAIFALFKTGDFNGGIRKALGLEEDSGIVATILTIRNGALGLKSAFSGEGITSDGFVGVMERIGVAVRTTLDVVHNFKSGLSGAFSASAFNGIVDGPLKTFALLGLRVRGSLQGVQDDLHNFAAGLAGKVGPAAFAGVADGPLKTFALLGSSVRQGIGQIGGVIGPLIPQVIAAWTAFSPLSLIFHAIQPMLPQLVGMFGQLASTLGSTLGSALGALVPLSSVLSQTLGGVLAAVLPAVVQIVTMLGSALTALLPAVVPIITTVVTLAATLIGQLVPIIMQLVTGILPPLISIFGNVFMAIGPLLSIIQALMPVVITVFGVVVNVIVAAMQIVQGIIQVVTGIISGNWAQVWQGILNIFGGIWNTIVAVISGAMAIVWSVISTGLSIVFGIVGSALGAIGNFFMSIWNNIVAFLGGVWSTIAGVVAVGVGMLAAPIVAGVTTVWNFVVSIFTAVGNFIAGVWNWIVGLVTNILIAFWQTHGAQLTAIWNTVVSIFNAIAGFISGVWNGIVAVVSAYVGAMVQVIIANLSAAWGFISSIFSTVFGFIGGIWNSIVGVIAGAVGAVWGSISSGFNQVAGFLGGIWNNIVSGVSGMISNVVGAFSGLSGSIMGALSGAGGWLVDIGKNIVQGLISGISSLAGTIGNAFLSLIPGWIVGPFKAALGIQSPSKLFRGFGKNIVEGLILGTGDKAGDLSDTMGGLVAAPDVPTFGADSYGLAAQVASTSQGFPSKVALMVGGREFEAYLVDTASSVVQSADSNSQYVRTGR